MCGIAGIIHTGSSSNIGSEMQAMLQAMVHRGPDSVGTALYRDSVRSDRYVICVKLAERNELKKSISIQRKFGERKNQVLACFESAGVPVASEKAMTDYVLRIEFSCSDEEKLRHLVDSVEYLPDVEILSLGNSLELFKDLGSADHVFKQYMLGGFMGTHAIGHTRMATESDVDIRSAHPFWAYPYSDISVVHNGQLTNYWSTRRVLERKGHRFKSDCDSELIAVYIANEMEAGNTLRDAMEKSIGEFDGVFTYIFATRNELGMAKDMLAAKPLVLYEGEDCTVMASEEVAIRSVFSHEIDTSDPYEGEVRVWSR